MLPTSSFAREFAVPGADASSIRVRRNDVGAIRNLVDE
jgi:hypothetical protein